MPFGRRGALVVDPAEAELVPDELGEADEDAGDRVRMLGEVRARSVLAVRRRRAVESGARRRGGAGPRGPRAWSSRAARRARRRRRARGTSRTAPRRRTDARSRTRAPPLASESPRSHPRWTPRERTRWGPRGSRRGTLPRWRRRGICGGCARARARGRGASPLDAGPRSWAPRRGPAWAGARAVVHAERVGDLVVRQVELVEEHLQLPLLQAEARVRREDRRELGPARGRAKGDDVGEGQAGAGRGWVGLR